MRMELKNLIVMLMFLLVVASIASAAEIIYVDDDASVGGDGSSWDTAFKYLQDGLAAVSYGDEIRVAQGSYKPGGSRTSTFQLINGVALKGGYAGAGEPDPNERDVEAYETILSGDLAGNDVDGLEPADMLDEPTRSENSLHVVTGSGTDETAVLNGFTIHHGHDDYDRRPYGCFGYGGGLYNDNGSPTVANCTFIGNLAGSSGGGIYNIGGSYPTLTNCTFTGNVAGTYPHVYGYSGSGGGVYGYNISFTNCTFLNNWAGNWGGAIRGSFPILINCTFIGNSAYNGGGMYNHQCNSTLTNCVFINNSAISSFQGSIGGGISDYGYDTDLILTNCIFTGNSADKGGAIFNRHSSPTLTNCTFTGNSANYGGALYSFWQGYENATTITNCILWGNSADEGPQIALNGGKLHVSYCDIQGGHLDILCIVGEYYDNELNWLDGNIGEDLVNDNPLFVDADGADNVVGTEDDNLHLLAGSPCIDAGDNSAVPPSVSTDLDGNPRIMNNTVDMGVYEELNQGFLLSRQSLTVLEGGVESFTVALAMDPLGTVEVTVAYQSGDSDITVESGGTLTFDSSNYSQPQTVTLAAAEDADNLSGQALIQVSASGILPVEVTATEEDNEPMSAILYVDAGAPGVNNGRSWVDAYTDLQDALSIAVEFPEVEEVRVAQGVYRPDQGVDVTAGDREATFQLINGVALKGGYAGAGEPDPNARDIEVYETILSGDLNGDDEGFTNNDENSYHVVTGSDTDATAILDGFTIRNGNANSSWPEDGGGGIFNSAGTPTLTNCTFIGNSGSSVGGGIYNHGADPTLTNCRFIGNSSIEGGGMFNYEGSSTVTNCTFVANSVSGDGGGIHNNGGTLTVTNSTFIGNSAGDDGGGITSWSCDQTLTNCILIGNWADDDGGGIFIVSTDSTITNCTFSDNSAGGSGGGIRNYNRNPTMTNCIVWENTDAGGMDESAQIHGGTSSLNYCCVQGWSDTWGGIGNFGEDPCFAGADANNFHLKSQAGRWEPSSASWVQDAVTSPCIDAGNPMSPIGYEPFPNGGVINMGAYGGTAEASKSYFGEPVCETIVAGDINGDCKVNFLDFRLMALHWLRDENQ